MYENVSVIISSRNCKYELVRTIRSVISQTVKVREIIVLDYDSTDGTVEYLKQEQLQDSITFIVGKEFNRTSKNKIIEDGLKFAHGKWITFVSCYSKWYENRMELIKKFLIDDKYELITSGYICHSRKIGVPVVWMQQKSTCCEGDLIPASSSFTLYKKSILQKIFEGMKLEWNTLEVSANILQCSTENVVAHNEVTGEEWIFTRGDKTEIEKSMCQYLRFCQLLQKQDWMNQHGFEFYSLLCRIFQKDYTEAYLMEKVMEVTENQNLKSFVKAYQLQVEKEKENSNRQLKRQSSFYQLMVKWMHLGLEGKTITDYFKKNEITKVAIYGAGKHGTMLEQYLRNEGTVVQCFIDKKLKGQEISGIPVCGLDSSLPQLDLIVISPYLEACLIKKDLEKWTDAKSIPMDQLINRCGE